MYSKNPTEEITLTEFEELASQRLQALKLVEAVRAKGLQADEQPAAILAAADKHGLRDPYCDRISHHILRLAYCRSEDLRRWFIQQETELFRVRFQQATDGEVDRFFASNDLDYQKLEDIDPAIRGNLKVSYEDRKDMGTFDYYKIPFEEALDLLKRRQVFLHQGCAYVSKKDMVHTVTARFRTALSMQLAALYRLSQNLVQDPRVTPLVAGLSKQHVGPAYKATSISGAVTRDQIPALADRSFPLCMENSYKVIKADSHAKHGGRMQFGLFLKGIGLTLNDALLFWQHAFSKKTPADQFQKKYAYNVRHNYGKEGKRTSYTPYSCMKIIQSAPGVGDSHGCPFKHFDEAHLRAKLRQKRVGILEMDEIIDLVKGSHFQIACSRYFQATHNGADTQVVHPNSYFDASMDYYREQEHGAGVKKENGVKEEQKPALKQESADMVIDKAAP